MLLLTGCGEQEGHRADGPGQNARPGVSATTRAEGRPVDVLRTRHILTALPDARDLPGWKVTTPPTDDGGEWCVAVVGPEACARIVAQGSATYVREGTASLTLAMFSGRTAEDARAVFDALRVKGTPSQALGALGDQRTYVRATTSNGAVTAETVVRDASTVLWVGVVGEAGHIDDAFVGEITRMLFDRTGQVRGGETPTARLGTDETSARR